MHLIGAIVHVPTEIWREVHVQALPVRSNNQLVVEGSHIYLSSYTGNTGSSYHHRMETAGLPSGNIIKMEKYSRHYR